eukprot:scaffold31963_cov17-Prasinocladus_malaysianus.AAC.1
MRPRGETSCVAEYLCRPPSLRYNRVSTGVKSFEPFGAATPLYARPSEFIAGRQRFVWLGGQASSRQAPPPAGRPPGRVLGTTVLVLVLN